MSDPSCRAYRELLGVYVVGAIEPAERAQVEAHLSQCYECREELAQLALLPALLHRVPAEEAERILATDPSAAGEASDYDVAMPSTAVLESLLGQVKAKRRTRRVRAAFATAAALLIAAGGAAAATHEFTPRPAAAGSAFETVSAHTDGIAVKVRYAKKSWGTLMEVRASGLPTWTHCKFWVVAKDGQRSLAGGWLVGYGGESIWYPARSYVPAASVASFVLTSGHRVLATIPAD